MYPLSDPTNIHYRKCKRLNGMVVSKALIEGVEQEIKAELDFL